jgi:UDP-N-acetylmuramoyl-tripeptide--D-alanyl-D-alanine ligase
MLNLGHILAGLSDYEAADHEPLLSSVVIDSRQAGPGSLFVAFAGENADGHDYVGAAFANGAVAALVERPMTTASVIDLRGGQAPPARWQPPVQIVVDNTLTALQAVAHYWRQQFPALRVIGITGSVGKTTTKEAMHRVLAQRFTTLKSPANHNNEIGLPLTLLQLRPEHTHAVLEMGMYVNGDIALLCDIARPQVGVLTLIGRVHLERVGTLERLIEGKREMVEALPADGVAVLNHDDAAVMSMVPYTQAQVVTYGLSADADVWADNIDSHGLAGISFDLHYRKDTTRDSVRVSMPMLGRHSVQTALRAAAVGLIEGLAWEEIVAGLQSHRDELRLLVVSGPDGSQILDDTYNASPASTMAVLNLLEELGGRKVAVLGDMLELGSAEIESHQRVGRRARDVADVLVAVGRRGRIIGEEALAVGMAADSVYFAESALDAVPILHGLIQPNDTILIKGSRGGRLDRITTALTQ